MRIKYKVKATRGWSPARRAVVREMVEWCSIVYQMNWEIYGKLTIKLVDMPDVFGDAIKLDDNRYQVRLSATHNSDWTTDSLIATIAHELRHVYQMIHFGFDSESGTTYWKGDEYDTETAEDWHTYANTPWEKDARHWEEKLTDIWTNMQKSS